MAQNKTTAQVGVAVGVAAAAAAAAAGAYWLYGAKDAAKNRKSVRGWMLKARGEVMEAVEKLQHVDREKYMTIVGTVLERYAGAAGVSSADLARMARDLKAAWNHIESAKHTGKRTVKKAAKKAKKKAKR